VRGSVASGEMEFHARAVSAKESAIGRSFAWSSSVAFLSEKAEAGEEATYHRNNWVGRS